VRNQTRKISVGASLAVFGGVAMALAPTAGATELVGPWSFLVGLAVGLVTSAGTALAVCGLAATRHK